MAQARHLAFMATPVGPAIVLFDPKRDACDGHDVPDTPLRAWRGADGRVHAFALHYENRRMSGDSLMDIKVECPVVFRGSGNADPTKFDDRTWIAATWTADGRIVHALGHHEYQANQHAGRCAFAEYLKCWWNSVIALRSDDGGKSFRRHDRAAVAATPFPQEIGQGRHRGFFNPSNIVERDGYLHTLIATTGWDGQSAGICLFRRRVHGTDAWRAWDGKTFSATFPGPYGGDSPSKATCVPLAPFPAVVGGLVRHRGSGQYLAIFQAKTGMPDGIGGSYQESGFYLASSVDLLQWSPPVFVLPTATLYDDPCNGGPQRSYPVLTDERAQTRNFEDIGDEAILTYAEMRIEGCKPTSDRKLIARKVRISQFLRD